MDRSLVILVFALLVTSTVITTMAPIVIVAKHDNSNSNSKKSDSGSATSGAITTKSTRLRIILQLAIQHCQIAVQPDNLQHQWTIRKGSRSKDLSAYVRSGIDSSCNGPEFNHP